MAFEIEVQVAVRDGVPVSRNDAALLPMSAILPMDKVTIYSGITWSEEQVYGIWHLFHHRLAPDLYITIRFWTIDKID